MKFLIGVIFALVALTAAGGEWRPTTDEEGVNRIHLSCVKQSGISNEQYQRFTRFGIPDEREVHKYILCQVKKAGLFTEDGGYNTERVLAQLNAMELRSDASSEKIRNAVTKCADRNEERSPSAVWAYRGVQCLVLEINKK